MSVGSLGNRSQPDDFMAFMLYQAFNEPTIIMRKLQKAALCILLCQVCYILTLSNKTMIPFCIMNFLMHCVYVHTYLMYTEDFRRKMRNEEESVKRVDEWYEKREKHKL